jgi:hypothetical protein
MYRDMISQIYKLVSKFEDGRPGMTLKAPAIER